MYPVYVEGARLQEEKGAHRSFNWALAGEKTHVDLFEKGKQAVDAGKDVDLGPLQVCGVCGWTHEGEAPDTCPICGAKKDMFQTFA